MTSTPLSVVLSMPIDYLGRKVDVEGDILAGGHCILVPFAAKKGYLTWEDVLEDGGGVLLQFPGLSFYLAGTNLITIGGIGVARVARVTGVLCPSPDPIVEYMISDITSLSVVGGWAETPGTFATSITQAAIQNAFDCHVEANLSSRTSPAAAKQFRDVMMENRNRW
jgi:hypothetical protein